MSDTPTAHGTDTTHLYFHPYQMWQVQILNKKKKFNDSLEANITFEQSSATFRTHAHNDAEVLAQFLGIILFVLLHTSSIKFDYVSYIVVF